MSYHDNNQSIEAPARKIIEGIDELEAAVRRRIESREWKAEHIDDITEALAEVYGVRMRLIRLAAENW